MKLENPLYWAMFAARIKFCVAKASTVELLTVTLPGGLGLSQMSAEDRHAFFARLSQRFLPRLYSRKDVTSKKKDGSSSITTNPAISSEHTSVGHLSAPAKPTSTTKKPVPQSIREISVTHSDNKSENKRNEQIKPNDTKKATVNNGKTTGISSIIIAQDTSTNNPSTKTVQSNKPNSQISDMQSKYRDINRIGTDSNILRTLLANLSHLKAVTADWKSGRIKNVSVIAIEDEAKKKRLMDFWERIEFHYETSDNGHASTAQPHTSDSPPGPKAILTDDSGLFRGILKENREDLIKSSKLSRAGFYIDKNTAEEEEEEGVVAAKNAIVALANHLKVGVGTLIGRSAPLGAAIEMLFNLDYPHKEQDIVEVCVCRTAECSGECREIRRVKRNSFL